MPFSDSRNQLPYDAHPIYQIRRASLYVAVFGGILNFLGAASSPYSWYRDEGSFFMFTILLLFISFLFCLHDLITYAIAKATQDVFQPSLLPSTRIEVHRSDDDDPKPKWPRKRHLIGDAILAVLFQVIFWMVFFTTWWRFGPIGAYAGLANLLASILHGMAFWKGIMARKHAQWRANLQKKLCARCGFLASRHGDEERAEAAAECPRQDIMGNGAARRWGVDPVITRSRSVADFDLEVGRKDDKQDQLLTPEGSTASSSGSSSYGTLDQTLGSMSSVEEKVVKKKGKKRVAVEGSDDGQVASSGRRSV